MGDWYFDDVHSTSTEWVSPGLDSARCLEYSMNDFSIIFPKPFLSSQQPSIVPVSPWPIDISNFFLETTFLIFRRGQPPIFYLTGGYNINYYISEFYILPVFSNLDEKSSFYRRYSTFRSSQKIRPDREADSSPGWEKEGWLGKEL